MSHGRGSGMGLLTLLSAAHDQPRLIPSVSSECAVVFGRLRHGFSVRDSSWISSRRFDHNALEGCYTVIEAARNAPAMFDTGDGFCGADTLNPGRPKRPSPVGSASER